MKAVRIEEGKKKRARSARYTPEGFCGALKASDGKPCAQPAGYGTTHRGIGSCKYHGGSTQTGTKAAAKQTAVLMGAPKEINPLDAIIWCIKMTGGEIDFYTEQMAYLKESNWIEETIAGQQMHIFARERALAQERLVNFSKIAITLGLTERAVKLAEQYGATVGRLIKGVLDDLLPYISKEGQEKIPFVVRKHLLLAEQGKTDLTTLASDRVKAIEA